MKAVVTKRLQQHMVFAAIIPLVGFAGTVYPTSDLLHVYPFFGLFLVSSFAYFYKKKTEWFWIGICLLVIASGFYLTLFREYERYRRPYSEQTVPLPVARARNILVTKAMAHDITNLSRFINTHTKKQAYILVYPFSPMLYFLLERRNASDFDIEYPGYRSTQEEQEMIGDLREKHVTYIITSGDYKFPTVLSQYIKRQKMVYPDGLFQVFQVIAYTY